MNIQELKCKNCFAAVEFDAATQKIHCPFCDSYFEEAEYEADLKAATEKANVTDDGGMDAKEYYSDDALEEIAKQNAFGVAVDPKTTDPSRKITYKTDAAGNILINKRFRFNPNIFDRNGHEWNDEGSSEMALYTCKECSGEVIGSKNAGTLRCPYCDHQLVFERQFAGDLSPEMIIPFKTSKEDAVKGYHEYLDKKKKFLPNIFTSNNHIEDIQGIYVPYWLFDADMSADYHLSCETDETWTKGDYEYTKTKTYDVVRRGKTAYRYVPADGSKNMPDDMMETIEPFDVSEAKEFKSLYLAGYIANRYDVTPDDCMTHIVTRMEESTHQAVMNSLPHYDRIHVLHEENKMSNGKIRYAMFPVWFLNTTYEGQPYTFAMNGQTGEFTGNLPKDEKKVIVKGLLYSIPIALILMIIGFIFGNVFGLVLGFGLGILFGELIAHSSAKKLMQPVKAKKNATDYFKDGGMTFSAKKDNFISEKTTKRRVNND